MNTSIAPTSTSRVATAQGRPTRIIGHEATIAGLYRAICADSIHHTLLFTGPSGIGKQLVAEALATTFMCLAHESGKAETTPHFGGCGNCHHCKLASAGNLPDLIRVSCGDRSAASTESVRDILSSLRLRPFGGSYRFLIFDDAHLLQGAAANALLKSLEEPRPGTFFVLLTDKPHLMLRTIHSRAQRWGFHQLKESELADILKREGIDIQESLIELAAGSVASYRLIQGEHTHLKTLNSQLKEIAHGNMAAALKLGNELSQQKDNFKENITYLHLLARKEMLHTQELHWANFLYELGEFEYYLTKRNFAPLYLLQNLFARLAERSQDQFIIENNGSLSDLIPA